MCGKIILFFCIILMWSRGLYAQADTTVQVHLTHNIMVCIGQGVKLTCPDSVPDKNVLTYQWVKVNAPGDSVIISNERSIVVRPTSSSAYHLNIQYLDMTNNLVKYGDFEGIYDRCDRPDGVLATDIFTTAYRWVPDGCDLRTLWEEGVYKVALNPSSYHSNFYNRVDHSSGEGQMLIVNGHWTPNTVVWQQKIEHIKPGEEYAFSAWGMRISDNGWEGENATATFQFSISQTKNDLGIIGGLYKTFKPKTTWTSMFEIWKNTAGWEEAYITLVDQTTIRNGNDFTIDDIVFAPVERMHGEITVNVKPRFRAEDMVDRSVCEGVNVEVKPVFYGEADHFQWYRDGVLLPGQSSKDLTLTGVGKSDAGKYTCEMSGGICGSGEAQFSLVVKDSTRLKPLEDQVVLLGKPAQFKLEVLSGELEIGYYIWDHPPGAKGWVNNFYTPKLYQKASVERTDVGVYACRVVATCGDVTVSARLDSMPVVKAEVSDPVSYCPDGDPVMLTGKRTPANTSEGYWIRVVPSDPDATVYRGDSLILTPGKVKDIAGIYEYRVRLTLTGDEFVGGRVAVDRRDTLRKLTFTGSGDYCEGGKVVLEGSAKVGGGTNYYWDKEPEFIYTWEVPAGSGLEISENVVTIPVMTPAQEGVYILSVSEGCTILRDSAGISIKEEFGDPKISGDLKVCLGESGRLEILDGVSGLSYTWTTPGGRGSNASSITLPHILAQDTGWYTCRLTSVCGRIMDLRTHISLYPGVTAAGPATPFVRCEGDRLEFTVSVNEGETYVWYKEGRQVGMADQPYVIEHVRFEDAGKYECIVTSQCGESKKLSYNLLVNLTTKITDRSPDQYVVPGSDVRLHVNAEGAGLRYAWQKVGGGNVGLDHNSLWFNPVAVENSGEYICRVTGTCGTDQARIKLSVGDYNEVTEDREENWCLGSTYSYTAALRPDGCTENAPLLYSWKDPKGREVSTAKALVVSKVTKDMAGEYVCTISGTCGTAILRLKAVVLALPEISVAPDREKFCEGENMDIKATVNDSIGSHTFEWRHNNAVLGTTVSKHSIIGAEMTDAGRYTCLVAAFCGTAIDTVDLTVSKGLRIFKEPESLNLCKGDEARLEVQATGDSLTYSWAGPAGGEWSRNDQSVYRNPSVSHNASGQYRCVLNSRCGIDTLYAKVVIEEDLVLVNRTPNVAACKGEDVLLWAQVNLDDVRYDWTFPDGTHSNREEITIHSITPDKRGNYICRIESAAGCSFLIDSIPVRIYAEPGELKLSPDTAVCEGGNARLSASMSGVDVGYTWMGPARFTADTAIVNIHAVDALRTGYYQVIAKDICNIQRQGKVNLTLREEFRNISVSADTTVCEGADVRFRVDGGVPGMTYEWSFDGVKIADGAELQLYDVQPDNVGKYICKINGTCSSGERAVNLALFKALEFAAITDLEKIVCDGETVVFGVAASGENVIYHWQKNGEDVGTMDSLLTLDRVISQDGGNYICRIESVCGEEEVIFGLRIKETTQIIGRSPDKHVAMKDSVNLKVIAKGENNVYEWKLGEEVLGNESELQIPNVGTLIKDYPYHVKVSGDCGEDTLTIWVKVGDYINVPVTGSDGDTICEGSNYTYVASLVPYGCYGGEPVTYKWTKYPAVSGSPIFIREGRSDLFKIEEVTPVDTGRYHCEIVFKGCPIDGFDPLITRDTSFDLHLAMIGVPVIRSVVPGDTSVIEGFDHQIRVTADGDALHYSWRHDNVYLPGENEDNIAFRPVCLADAGLYRVTVENVCSKMEAISRLRVYQKTIITSPYEQWLDVCLHNDITLQTNAVGSNLVYRWYIEGRLVAAASSDTYTVKNLNDDVDYMCIVSGNGGKDTCIYHLMVKDLPEATIEGKDFICMSPENYRQEYKLVSRKSDLVAEWNCAGGIVTPAPGGQKAEVLWDGSGEAQVEILVTSLTTGCVNRVEKEIRYVALPEIWLDLPDKVGYCIDSLVLNKVWPLGGHFVWRGDTVTSLVFAEKDKVYQPVYYYTDPLTQCTGSGEQQVGIDEEPAIRLAKRKDTTGMCRPLVLTVASHSPGTIVWRGSGRYLDTTDVLNVVYTPSENDGNNVYYEAGLTDFYGCQASDNERILVVGSPQVLAMNDTIVGSCEEDSEIGLVLKAQYITAYFDRLNWLPEEKTNVNADYTAEILRLDPGQNIFTARIYDVFGCSGQDDVAVTLITPADLENREICFGDTLHIASGEYRDFRWSDGYLLPQRVLTQVGTDTLWVKNEFGCESMAAYTIRPLPQTDLVDTSLLRGHVLNLNLNLDPLYGPYDICWQDGSAVSVYPVRVDGEYWVRILDNIGCSTEDSVRITFIDGIYAPNAFLPESNGENSRFYLKELNFIGDFKMLIYNRWGELIYETREIGFKGGWDGTFKGKKCDVGTYVWVAFNNGERLGRGTVTLIK